MSVGLGGSGGIGPMGPQGLPDGPEDLESVSGAKDEDAVRDGLKFKHAGFWAKAASILPPWNRAVVSRTSIDGLPAFSIEAKDGSYLNVDLVSNRFDDDGDYRPATCFRLGSGQGPETLPALLIAPGKPTEIGEGLGMGGYAGAWDDPPPLSIRHALVVRPAVDQMQAYLKAAAAAGAPLKAGGTAQEIASATQLLAGTDAELKALESILARSPEASLTAEVYQRLATRAFGTDAEFDQAITDLQAALTSIDGRTGLSASEREQVKADLQDVLFMTRHWGTYDGRFSRTEVGFPATMYPGRT